ncbi:MAG: UDP-N-acetyl-D-glucosamine dehydrogenase [Opitutae bacterium]|nr:UDP-N-acetyl-D-glucosamine dehydrogenase [Opitutae bacterium]|tara:strand:- start:9529 stop:10803 length:1275 start_codon:yes stop_codon:yes gene_type:complete
MSFDRIAVIGLGYVGLPLSLQFARSGVSVLGLDTDESKVESIKAGESYLKHFSSEEILEQNAAGRFTASMEFSSVREVEAILICVPTPLDEHRQPDLSFVLDTANAIAPHLSKGTLVSLESTTYPGTTENELREALEVGSGLEAGVDFHLAYSPEREDPGRVDASMKTIPKVVGGLTKRCEELAERLYLRAIDCVHCVSSCRVAEATKLLENIFRSVNIALVNELKVVYDAMGINVHEVITAAGTKPFGFMAFRPGPGLGGHCIPIDPFYLTWKAREFGRHTRFIELAGEINASMPDYVIGKVIAALNKEGKAVNGASILLLGLAYKADVDDCRESPSFVLMDNLETRGATVDYNDPNVPVIPETREHAKFAGRKSVPISDDYDLLLLVTDHTEYENYDFSAFSVPLVDTRDCVNNRPAKYLSA